MIFTSFSVFCCKKRGTDSDPIEFHIRENLADAMIGQLIYKNITREGATRSINMKKPTLPTAAAVPVAVPAAPPLATTTAKTQTHRQERYMNARFNKNKTKIKKNPPSYKRTHRNVNLEDQFYVSVTPSVFYNDLIAFESEKVPVTAAPHTAITRSTTVSVSAKSTSTVARHHPQATTTTATEHIFTNDMTTIDNLLNDISSKRSNSSTASMSKVVLVTPRPIRKQNDGKSLLRHNLTDLINATARTGKQMRRRPTELNHSKRGLRFVIANQHDVNSMIAISNDGILMTLKPLDREERDVYHLTIIAEYVQGYVTGAGIYQVVIYVDDVNGKCTK